MMPVKKLALCAASLLCLAALGAYGGPREDLVRKVLDVTGVERQFGDASDAISALYGQQESSIDPKYYRAVLDVVARQFGETAFVDYIEEDIESEYDEASLRRILADYEAPLFQTITRREIETKEGDMQARLPGFDYSKVDPERDRIFSKYIVDADIVGMSEQLAVESLKAFFTTYNLLMPKERKLPDGALEGIYEQARASLRSEESVSGIKKRLAITYEPFSNEELSSYFAFYSSPEGAWLCRRLTDGVSKAFQKCLSNAAQELLGILKDA